MTNLYIPPRLKAHKLSAAVGSGKTRAAIAWIASPTNATRNVLYVAPTRALIKQTESGLRYAIGQASTSQVRNVHGIHMDTTEVGQVKAEAQAAVNSTEPDEGAVWLLTTATFLAIASKIKRPELWTVILDEAFEPATFETIKLGTESLGGWSNFTTLFQVDPDQGFRILPRAGRRALVEGVAQSDYNAAGDHFRYLQGIAQAVTNSAIRCELVMTDGTRALLDGRTPPRRSKDKDRGIALQFASYVDPSAFAGFREVLFLSALFEQTVLYHLWTKALHVKFEEHPEFPSHLLRDTHKEAARFLAVGHLLHREDNASLENLSREARTGQAGPGTPGTRVIDHLVRTAAAHFSGEQFLLQSNARYGYVEGKDCVPRNAVVIPVQAHGLNTFQAVDNVAALAVTNPNPQQLEWVRSRTGMSKAEVTQAYRIHATYQALGRCSIRRAESSTNPKVVLVVGADDARFIADLFPGSHWLGQVGTLPSLSSLQQRTENKEPGKIETLARLVIQVLDGLPATQAQVTSRWLKGAVERHQAHLRVLGSDGEVCIASQTWTNAVSQACLLGRGWQKQGQHLLRVNAALYGFALAA